MSDMQQTFSAHTYGGSLNDFRTVLYKVNENNKPLQTNGQINIAITSLKTENSAVYNQALAKLAAAEAAGSSYMPSIRVGIMTKCLGLATHPSETLDIGFKTLPWQNLC